MLTNDIVGFEQPGPELYEDRLGGEYDFFFFMQKKKISQLCHLRSGILKNRP